MNITTITSNYDYNFKWKITLITYFIRFVVGGNLYPLFGSNALTTLQEVDHETSVEQVEVHGGHVVHTTTDLFLQEPMTLLYQHL